jgi:hypothetical protein
MPSAYHEERARLARTVFDFLVKWAPPPFGGLSPDHLKTSILSGSGDLLLRAMLSEGLLDDPDKQTLLEALKYSRSVFDNTEVSDAGHGCRERIFANVYDLVLGAQRIGSVDGRGTTVFRGQRDSAWQLIPSYYRSAPERGQAERAEHLKRTVLEGQLSYLRRKHPAVDFSQLTTLQREAIVQHYFSGTELLDFTDSMYVAAFFATERSGGDAPAMGAVYRISRKDVQDNLMLAKVEAPEISPAFQRIHRQRGSFLRIRFRDAINDAGLFDRWVFRHTEAGSPFECETLSITAKDLLVDLTG